MIRLRKHLILFVAVSIFVLAAAVDAQTLETFHNIQIIVEMRQAAYQNQPGSQTTSQSTQTQFIVVTEGVDGRIFIGERVPYTLYYQNYLTQEGYLTGSIIFQDVGTSLIVRARVVGAGQIEVTLTPEISYQSTDGRGSIAVQKMSTSVIEIG